MLKTARYGWQEHSAAEFETAGMKLGLQHCVHVEKSVILICVRSRPNTVFRDFLYNDDKDTGEKKLLKQ